MLNFLDCILDQSQLIIQAIFVILLLSLKIYFCKVSWFLLFNKIKW